ncbi:hypothetical protein OG874_41245 [Nocardia sp. NBC_00565]|uniref:hypothetical protein n=1 Tax=Nocardia sp. NBC_00565 TaxID=2975993 RepID=UPI002E81E007|nr:hypothetical protein [Nocardia sp. NBC_00565]WUC03043.1 hypothetical protein OG874_41245 [Nocardia sp. NBC_00565]
MASTSLPLATAAAVATLFAAPAGAVPDQPSTPTNPAPAPADPGTSAPTDQAQPETTKPDPGKPETKPTPSQPGVTTPDPNQVMPNQPKDPKLSVPTQPGVTTPRVAPLPVPGQTGPAIPAVVPETAPGTTPKPAEPGAVNPTDPNARTAQQPETETLVQQPRWQAPRFQQAPAAPVVEMDGPHQEISANIDGGSLASGYVANTHHFNNADGYVGTIGYRTPTGAGEAGVSVEYIGANTVKVTSYTGGEGLADNKTELVLDTTQANLAKAAVEHWIREQPGGEAALEAAAQVKLPVPPGELAPQTVNVAGVTTQWGGSLQY